MERKFRELQESTEILELNKKYSSAFIVNWVQIRFEIFNYLTLKKIDFHSTQSAIYEFYKHVNEKEFSNGIHSLYTMVTMIEFYSDIEMREKEYLVFKNITKNITDFIYGR